MSVSVHGGPPKIMLKEGQGAANSREAGELGSVLPLEDLRADSQTQRDGY